MKVDMHIVDSVTGRCTVERIRGPRRDLRAQVRACARRDGVASAWAWAVKPEARQGQRMLESADADL
ncbi:hypothetical protein HNQ01_001932 [Leptothrix sp. C29]|uniref:Uncharacterized protein n=2 Tax=Sphaerotilus uruguayifluvii TaxID=2735897 RepID=A0ABX2G349_9BURK|nr:hypothetical protein [Leptothrix sp. C29]